MKATLVLLHSHYSKKHLEDVKTEMLSLGAPKLRGVDCGEGVIYLLEGCHRARAAAELGLTVTIENVPYDWDTDANTRICDHIADGDCDNELGSVVGVGATGDRCVDCNVEVE